MGFRIRALQREEIDGFLCCFQASFGVDGQSLAIIRNSLVNDPSFHPQRVRLGVLDGQIISHVVVLHRAAWVGNQAVTVAGITAVATHPYYQGRGFGTRVMRDALHLVRKRGYGLAMLTTQVPGFFVRLGFTGVPAAIGYQCPASALARLETVAEYQVERLDYNADWPTLGAIYREYSDGRTGMQLRDVRFWESWPRRGTFPHGFSSSLDAIGLLARREGRVAAYLAAHGGADPATLTVTDFAHCDEEPEALLPLLQNAANLWRTAGGRRVVIHSGGEAPVLRLLEAQGVPLELDIGQGLMALIVHQQWIKAAGFRDQQDALQGLFPSGRPLMWHRDGY